MTTDRMSLDVDIACVGFGPAAGGFLTTLSRAMSSGEAPLESRVMPGMPPQIVCYERADDIGFGVSGVVTRARGIRESFPDIGPSNLPMCHPVGEEKTLYLRDPHGASRRSPGVRTVDALTRMFKGPLPGRDDALELPYTPEFLEKRDGFVMSIGQFNQWVGSQVMGSGLVQIWPGTPVAEALIDEGTVAGVRLADQGTDRGGAPEAGYMPGMDVRARLTVVADGPVGPIGRQLDAHYGMPPGHEIRDWAVGMKMVVDLPPDTPLKPGTVYHSFGYPEPEIFGFLYTYPDNTATVGIFVPSWLDSPVRTSYRYLQHWMRHPYIWRYLQGSTMRSWGAKSLQEAGRRGEPYLVGPGYARIGEGSGTTNVLTGSGVDEAWTSGKLLAEGVLELWREGAAFTKENLERAYVSKRRVSWIETEAKVAEHARDGFQRGVLTGIVGMGLTGISGGKLGLKGSSKRPRERVPSLEEYYDGTIPAEEVRTIRDTAYAKGDSAHEALMRRAGWPDIPYDGKLLVSQQDALLMGGKVQAPTGYADHVVFLYPNACETCSTKLCVEVCSGQAITPGENGIPHFDREKCVHCGACFWNCTEPHAEDPEQSALAFRSGAGGLHSGEN